MLTNYHTHSVFCDGKDTPEEMVTAAINAGFTALGFSGHSTTEFDMRYCMKDIPAYIIEIKRLKEKYKKEIQIYLGIEEDSFTRCSREDFEYMIGSCHCVKIRDKIYPIDICIEEFSEILSLFDNNPLKFAEEYYSHYCDYILSRKPDIVGHFDLITKFEEKSPSIFFDNPKYNAMAEKYLKAAAESGCIFEVNTGAISRGYRTNPYPSENLLYCLKNSNAKIMLSSDCHDKTKLTCSFSETALMLKDIGFCHTYALLDGEFKKVSL